MLLTKDFFIHPNLVFLNSQISRELCLLKLEASAYKCIHLFPSTFMSISFTTTTPLTILSAKQAGQPDVRLLTRQAWSEPLPGRTATAPPLRGMVTLHGTTESRDTSPSYSLSPGRHISWPQVHAASTGIERKTGTVRIPHYLTEALKQFKITPVKEKQHFSLISQFSSLQGIVLLNRTGSVLMRTTEGLTQLFPKSA